MKADEKHIIDTHKTSTTTNTIPGSNLVELFATIRKKPPAMLSVDTRNAAAAAVFIDSDDDDDSGDEGDDDDDAHRSYYPKINTIVAKFVSLKFANYKYIFITLLT